jgi:hypothetical protein
VDTILLICSMDLNGDNDVTIVAEDDRHKLICLTNGIKYTADPVKHVYGICDRKALEEWFLYELRWFEKDYPDYDVLMYLL